MAVCGPASPGPQSRQDAAGFTLSRTSMLSGVRLFVTEWTSQTARLLSLCNFPGKDTGGGCHFLLQGNLPDPGIKPTSSASAGGFFTTEAPGQPPWKLHSLGMVTRQREPGPGSSTVGWGESHEEMGTGCLPSTAGCKSLAQLCKPPTAVWGQVVPVQA